VSQNWTSYDAAARTHDRLAVPSMFAGPARDMAARIDAGNAGTALDVGAGSGVVALAMSACPVVVAVDPSLAMLRVAQENGVAHVVAGGLPSLPFPDAAFDRVTAGFVVSHVASYQAALAEMVRVLRPGGKLGVTSWSMLDNQFRDYWDGLVEQAVGREALRAANARWLPWEDWFADRGRLREALDEAGLREVTVEEIEYPIHITIADFLTIREVSGTARFLRSVLDADAAERFFETARAEFSKRFRDPIDHTRRALIATGMR
jgi:ubiquinone/menaquinone biosynthesis C-methylase UbiE